MWVPLKVDVQDGMREAALWEGAGALGILDEPHTTQSARCVHQSATRMGNRPAFGVLDRFFLCRHTVETIDALDAATALAGCPERLVEIVTKARTTCVAWTEPPEREPHRPGRPRKKGEVVRPHLVIERLLGPLPAKVKSKANVKEKAEEADKPKSEDAETEGPKGDGGRSADDRADGDGGRAAADGAKGDDCAKGDGEAGPRRGRARPTDTALSCADGAPWEFTEVWAGVGGERRRNRALVLDLLWGEGLYRKMRFVLCRDDEGRDQVLVTTDLTLTAPQVIELYTLRWEIMPMSA